MSEAEIIKSAHVHNEMSNEFIGSREFIFDNEARSVLYTAAQAYIAYGDREALEACRQLNLSLSKGESEKFKYNLNKDEFENLTNIVGMDIVDKSSQERKVEISEEMSSLNKGTLTISQLPSENKWLSAFYSKNIEAAKELLKDSFLKNSSK